MPPDDADTPREVSGDDDHDAAAGAEFTPPIWAVGAKPESQPEPGPMALGLPMSALAGGGAVVALAALLMVGVIASRGPTVAPQVRPSRATATEPAAATPSVASPAPRPVVSTVACRYRRTTEGSVRRRAKLPKASGVVNTGAVSVELTTNRGPLVLDLDRSRAPCAVNSFISLASQAFFAKTSCHRVTTKIIFVLQCGDPSGTGFGGPGYSFADEGLPSVRTQSVTYPAGTVAMANGGPNDNGSQFFIVYQDSELLPTWTIFATLSGGLDVVRGVAAAGSNPAGDGKPKAPVVIESVAQR